MKTGTYDRAFKRSQETNYLSATQGNAFSFGQKAKQARLFDGNVPTKMYLIEPK